MRPSNLIILSIITGMSIYCVIHLFIKSNTNSFIFEMYFCSLIASIIYTTFLLIYEISHKNTQNANYQQITNESNKFFITTTYSKFLFPIFFATLFNYICFVLLMTNFDSIKNGKFLNVLVEIHINVIMPLYMLFDLIYLTKHTRSPSYLKDMIFIVIIFMLRWLIGNIGKSIILDNYPTSLFIYDLGFTIPNALLAINGYYLYDYILFKKYNPETNYSVMI